MRMQVVLGVPFPSIECLGTRLQPNMAQIMDFAIYMYRHLIQKL